MRADRSEDNAFRQGGSCPSQREQGTAYGGKDYLIQLNDNLNFDLTEQSGNYFLQKTYCALINVCGLEENDGDVSNKNVKAANYIIDCFNAINHKHRNVGEWYNGGSNGIGFMSPYVNREMIKC